MTAASNQPNALLAALGYAARGWAVLPPQPGEKKPLTAHGFKDATTDESIIRGVWQRWPDANVGIATGSSSRLLVVDVDSRNGGRETLAALQDGGWSFCRTPLAVTGGEPDGRNRSGVHYYYLLPEGVAPPRSRPNALGGGVDIKCSGGYVVAPPSVHPSGRHYRWLHSPEETPVAEAPDWLLRGASSKEKQRSSDGASTGEDEAEAILEGQRNAALTRIAGRLRNRGLTPREIRVLLCDINKERCRPPLDPDEVAGIAESIGSCQPSVGVDPIRPEIVTSGRFMHEISDDCLDALSKANGEAPSTFCRGGALVDLPPGEAGAIPLGAAGLTGRLDRIAYFVSEGEKGRQPSRPPRDNVADLLAMRRPRGIPELRTIATTPVFLPDGRLVATEGYDHASGTAVRLGGSLEGVRADIPIADAVDWLLGELLVNFPFADDGSRVHAIAALLQPAVRQLIKGPTPLYLFEAPTPGTGKNLLAEAIATVVRGNSAPVMSMSRDPDELRKHITSNLIVARSLILLDNLEGN